MENTDPEFHRNRSIDLLRHANELMEQAKKIDEDHQKLDRIRENVIEASGYSHATDYARRINVSHNDFKTIMIKGIAQCQNELNDKVRPIYKQLYDLFTTQS